MNIRVKIVFQQVCKNSEILVTDYMYVDMNITNCEIWVTDYIDMNIIYCKLVFKTILNLLIKNNLVSVFLY